MRQRNRIARVAAGVVLVVTGLAGGTASGQTTRPRIAGLELDGVVDPWVADYIRAGIQTAAADSAEAVLLRVDTPGGLDSAMREITQAILTADVPVICYVTPSGARAASAGAVILVACPVAAMAPGTNVGASTPIGLSGGDLANKIQNDAAAYVRSLAERTGRNPQLAEEFVTKAASISAEEALDGNVIDLISPSDAELLGALDGRSVSFGEGQSAVLHTAGAEIVDHAFGGPAGFLHDLIDPSIAFIFFWLGLILLVIELLVPGHIFSGTVGLVMFAISLGTFGLLPVRFLGLALLVASVVFLVLELKVPGLGLWSILGVTSLVLGGWFLFDRAGGVEVSPAAIVPTAAVVALFSGFVVTKLFALRHMPPAQGPEAVIGREGVVVGIGLSPDGVVRVAAEEWNAVSATGPIPGGTKIKVIALDGLVLTVEPSDIEHAPAGGAAPAQGGNI